MTTTYTDDSDKTDDKADTIARIVVERYRRAKQFRDTHIVHQGKSFSALLERAEHQYRREYTCDDASDLERAFGFTPTRYYGITQQKVNATVAWSNDLIISNLDSMFTATPSPEPTLDKASQKRIREGVRRELIQRMSKAGLADVELLLDARGRPAARIEEFLYEQIRALKKVEQARLVGLAADQAQAMQRRMRDMTIEGGFRQAYAAYTFDRHLFGIGYMRFPDWQRRRILRHTDSGKVKMVWDVVPFFRHIPVRNFFPLPDGEDLQNNTGNTEYSSISKIDLINLARVEGFNKKMIEEILDDYAFRSRNWLGDPEDADWWDMDEPITLLRHEGLFSGGELREYGISGYDTLDYVTARVEIVGNRTIRCQVKEMPGGFERSYFGAPFSQIGNNHHDVLGMAAMLWDTEQRLNRFMHLFEHNADWASRPPRMVNPTVFANPLDARNIVPGGEYEVEDRFATSGSMPEPIRNMNAVSAQYHLLMTQVHALTRQADEDCGIPAYAYGAQDYGRSSLGEFSQRMSNALRTVKQAALNEDIHLIEPTFSGLFRYIMETDDELRAGQDVNLVVRGMTGLLQEDQKTKHQQQLIPMILQMAQGNVVPKQAGDYAVRVLLEQAGFPVDALGLSDPVIENALAVAAASPLPGYTVGGQQVPPLDGRSAVPAQNVAAPNGASQFAIPAPGGAVTV